MTQLRNPSRPSLKTRELAAALVLHRAPRFRGLVERLSSHDCRRPSSPVRCGRTMPDDPVRNALLGESRQLRYAAHRGTVCEPGQRPWRASSFRMDAYAWRWELAAPGNEENLDTRWQRRVYKDLIQAAKWKSRRRACRKGRCAWLRTVDSPSTTSEPYIQDPNIEMLNSSGYNHS